MFRDWRIEIQGETGLYSNSSRDDWQGFPVVGDVQDLLLRLQFGGEERVRCRIIDVDQGGWDRTVKVVITA